MALFLTPSRDDEEEVAMQHQRFALYICLICFTFTGSGCVALDDNPASSDDEDEADGPPEIMEHSPLLKISRSFYLDLKRMLSARIPDPCGRALLPEEWLRSVTETFYTTPVETALDDENWYEDWQVASIR